LCGFADDVDLAVLQFRQLSMMLSTFFDRPAVGVSPDQWIQQFCQRAWARGFGKPVAMSQAQHVQDFH
jgi:hypothetical protein